MSLLIKALETAEKDKQAEQNKSKASRFSAGLALEPLSVEAAIDAGKKNALNLMTDNAPTDEITGNNDAFNSSTAASVEKVRSQSSNTTDSKQKVAANVFVANQSLNPRLRFLA